MLTEGQRTFRLSGRVPQELELQFYTIRVNIANKITFYNQNSYDTSSLDLA